MKMLFTIFLLIMFNRVAAQENILDQYISEAFKTNQGLKSQQLQLDKSFYALKEAHALFLPNISLAATYSRAEGGRTIQLPLGDLLNPVYKSLNQLTNSAKFPELNNQSVLLNPDNYYDAHFRTTLSLVNLEINYNEKIKKENITYQRAEVNVYKRELVKEIKIAYYKYYQAVKAVEIYKNALLLIAENIRVNQSLLKNGMRNSTALTRSETEMQKIEASITLAEGAKDNGRAYLNFLINRPLETDILMDTASFITDPGSMQAVMHSNTGNREEIQQTQSAVNIQDLNKKLQSSFLVPKLNTYFDLGSQGYQFQYNGKTRYYLLGLNLEVNLFAGGLHKYRIKEASLGKEVAEAEYNQTAAQMQMQLLQSINNLHTALSDFQNAKMQLSLADKYYADQIKVYKAGQLLYIELLDALTQVTNARLQVAVTIANMQIAYTNIERDAAIYPLNT